MLRIAIQLVAAMLLIMGAHHTVCADDAVLTHTDMQRLFDDANRVFDDAAKMNADNPESAAPLFQRAIAGYETILRNGRIENGTLRYNIGNAHLLLGDVGRAIVSYRRAERTMRGDANLQRNLAAARARVVDRIEDQQQNGGTALLTWHTDIPAGVRFVVGACAFSTMWLVMLSRLVGILRFRVRGIAITLLIAWTACFTSLTVEQQQHVRTTEAVIVADEVIGRKGPDASGYEPSFTRALHGGVEVRIIEKRTGWLRVELQDGRETWLPISAVEAI
ncbi:MAG: hypothetical protein KAS72_08890 [Phycisphaerales bacterium]|nr:hypothetical protein [Phycisphaerales bacterium]